MKYGIVLPTFVHSIDRTRLVTAAFASLENTVHDGNKPELLLIQKQSVFHNQPVTEKLLEAFNVNLVPDPANIQGTEQTLAWGTQDLFDMGCDYVTWMGDDALFHPQWHMKLRKLIADKPDAVGWSVYRSAYELYHQTLLEEEEYVRVSTLCGHGMTISKEEWKAWGIDWHLGVWYSPAGDTLDLHHAFARTMDNRWTTKVSYIEHTGRRGLHCTPEIPEYAVSFQGIL